MSGMLLRERPADDVLMLTIDRPAAHNAIDLALAADLRAALRDPSRRGR